MTAAGLLVAGIATGLTGSVTGLASLVSYPVLLAYGLAPISANVTGAVATLTTTVGAAISSRTELRGQWRRAAAVSVTGAVGAAVGMVLLLATPSHIFERIVPWLIAIGAVALLMRDRLRSMVTATRAGAGGGSGRAPLVVLVLFVGTYAGYFAATAGILMLVVLSITAHESLAVSNAVKNVVMGAVNLTAVVGYAFLAPIDWGAAMPMAVGCLAGSWLGPFVVRRIPERPLGIAIALAGCGLATQLWLSGGS